MSPRTPIPDVDTLGGLRMKRTLHAAAGLIGARQRNNQIQLRAGIDTPADASKNSIYFAESSKSIDVDRREHRGLRDQFFVCHEVPRAGFVPHGEQSTAGFPTQSDSTEGSSNRHNTSLCGGAASVLHSLVNSAASAALTEIPNSPSSYQFVGHPSPDEAPGACPPSHPPVAGAATSMGAA